MLERVEFEVSGTVKLSESGHYYENVSVVCRTCKKVLWSLDEGDLKAHQRAEHRKKGENGA